MLAERCARRVVHVAQLEADHVALGVLGDEHQVDDADQSGLHQLTERRSDLTGELIAWKHELENLDRSGAHVDLPWVPADVLRFERHHSQTSPGAGRREGSMDNEAEWERNARWWQREFTAGVD